MHANPHSEQYTCFQQGGNTVEGTHCTYLLLKYWERKGPKNNLNLLSILVFIVLYIFDIPTVFLGRGVQMPEAARAG